MLFVTRGSYRLQEVSIYFDWYGSVVTKRRLNVYLTVVENLSETHRFIQYIVVKRKKYNYLSIYCMVDMFKTIMYNISII